MRLKSGPVINLEELTKIAKKNGFMLQQAYLHSDDREGMILLGADIGPIVDFAVTVDRKILFYDYVYLAKEDHLVDEAECDIFGNGMPPSARRFLKEYNRKVEGIDFSLPFALNVFCLYEGRIIGVTMADQDMMEIATTFPEDIINETQMISVMSWDEETKIEKTERRNALHKELLSIVTADEEFGKKTNASQRKEYLETLLEKPENKKYSEIFSYTRFGPKWSKIDFLAAAARDSKDKRKKQ